MDNNDIQLIGGPCGQHGPYTFYKAFKYSKNGVKRIVTLSEFFFVKLWVDSDLICIGELQLLWIDKNSEQVLSSLRLYFLPENTPDGRTEHGEDEVLAIQEKVVIRVEDLISWITVDAEWTWGSLAKCDSEVKKPKNQEDALEHSSPPVDSSLDFSDIDKERKLLDCDRERRGRPSVLILSYPRYCRYRAMMKRLEGAECDYLKVRAVNALGGFTVLARNTRVLFCRDTFEYPELEGHELLCNHLAPKMKGRPRGRRKKRSVSPGSESNESEEAAISAAAALAKASISSTSQNEPSTSTGRRSARLTEINNESKDFMKKLNQFMKQNRTPIGRVPSLGYKEIDLFTFYSKVQKLGGYNSVTRHRLWKSIFEEMNGHQNSTSAATVIRRHYERLLLPYERHVKGEKYKPLPAAERRRLKSKNSSSISDNEGSESTLTSGDSTPASSATPTPQQATKSIDTDNKDSGSIVKPEVKTSSLRSVRVKPERQKDKQNSNEQCNNNNNNNSTSNNNNPSDNNNTSNNNNTSDNNTTSNNNNTSTNNTSNNNNTSSSSTEIKCEFKEIDVTLVCEEEGETSEDPNLDVTVNSMPDKTEVTPIKTEVTPIKTEVKEIKTEDAFVTAESTVKSEHGAPDIESAAVECDVKAEIISVKTETLIKTEDVSTKDEESDNVEVVLIKPEIIPIKPTMIPKKIEILPNRTEMISLKMDKNAEPLTSAVAPVVQKMNPEKNLSPVEGKENIPVIRTGDTASTNSKSPELIDVPYKPKSPDVNVDSNAYKSISNFTNDFKKRKLDILKEGGLEVTPVRSFLAPNITKDVRPSVIHQATSEPHTGMKTSKSDTQTMPPPSMNSIVPKRLSISVPQMLNISQVSVPNVPLKTPKPSNTNTNHMNGFPPKVVQSRSIYSYSERTVYGNPRDELMSSSQIPAHTPKFPSPRSRHSGGDILDLSVSSPQKPMVEIMRVPNVPMPSQPFGPRDYTSRAHYRSSSPIIDGRRLGSNLEITLVGSHSKGHKVPSSPVKASIPPAMMSSANNGRYGQKRPALDNGITGHNKVRRSEDNEKFVGPSSSMSSHSPLSGKSGKFDVEISIPSVFRTPSSKPDHVSHLKHPLQSAALGSKLFPATTSAQLPTYLSQIYDTNKTLNPYLPLMDPALYYSAAVQNLYSQGSLPPPHPMMPFLSPEQLKLYSDFVAHNARLSSAYPFPLPQDGAPSPVNSNSGFKKP